LVLMSWGRKAEGGKLSRTAECRVSGLLDSTLLRRVNVVPCYDYDRTLMRSGGYSS
jgi:hypothetical protein